MTLGILHNAGLVGLFWRPNGAEWPKIPIALEDLGRFRRLVPEFLERFFERFFDGMGASRLEMGSAGVVQASHYGRFIKMQCGGYLGVQAEEGLRPPMDHATHNLRALRGSDLPFTREIHPGCECLEVFKTSGPTCRFNESLEMPGSKR